MRDMIVRHRYSGMLAFAQSEYDGTFRVMDISALDDRGSADNAWSKPINPDEFHAEWVAIQGGHLVYLFNPFFKTIEIIRQEFPDGL